MMLKEFGISLDSIWDVQIVNFILTGKKKILKIFIQNIIADYLDCIIFKMRNY